MALALFDESTGWDEARRTVRHTRSALGATPDHGKLASSLTAILTAWKKVDGDREDADDATVDANALVHYWDVQLDILVAKLASQARNDHGADSKEFKKLFPEPPHEVVRLGLESEITRVEKFDVVAKEMKLSKEVSAILKSITHVCASGAKALEARVDAAKQTAQVSLRVSSWKDDANGARRSVDTALDDWANKHHLPRDYADAFFPVTRSSSRKAATAPVAASPPTPPTT